MNQKKFLIKKNTELDHFYWLERPSKKISIWLRKQQERMQNYLAECDNRASFTKQYKSLFLVDSMKLPVMRGDFYFFRYRKAMEEDYSIYMKKGLKGKKHLLIDSSQLSSKDKTSIAGWHPSKDGRFIAVELSKSNNDKTEIKIFDVQQKMFLREHVPAIQYPYFNVWDNDSLGFWYTRGTSIKRGDEKYYRRLYFHRIGEKNTHDKLYFGENLEKEDVPGITCSDDGKYGVITIDKNDDTTSILLCNLQNRDAPNIEITKGMKARSSAYINESYIYIVTNHRAPRKKILRRRIYQDRLGEWEVYVPETTNNLENVVMTSRYLFLEYTIDVQSKLFAIDIRTNEKKEILLPAMGSMTGFSSEFKSENIFFSFSSFSIAASIYKIDVNDLTVSLFWTSRVSPQRNNLITKQLWFPSKDTTPIPMFLVYKKGLVMNGKNPTLVYAYGGFNISLTPSFNKTIIPFLDDGGIYVLVNIRGGGEFGELWHKKAILKNKQKSFDDFSCALRFLTKKKYTCPDKIAIWGASNGGLLMSVTLIQHPELFKAAIVSVPVTDMLRFHVFNGGRYWISDYGDPDDTKARSYLLRYSPYHNIKNINYPSALFLTSDQDDRVHPMHSYKMVAKLLSNSAQKNSILLRVEKNAGHGGGNTVTSSLRASVDIMSFLYKELDI